MNATKVLVVLAGACFLLATFGVEIGSVSLVPLGLAVYMASKLT